MRVRTVRHATLRTAELDSANAQYHEMSTPLRRIVKSRKEKKDKPVETFVEFCELFDYGR